LQLRLLTAVAQGIQELLPLVSKIFDFLRYVSVPLLLVEPTTQRVRHDTLRVYLEQQILFIQSQHEVQVVLFDSSQGDSKRHDVLMPYFIAILELIENGLSK
jgi:hypothetical protein